MSNSSIVFLNGLLYISILIYASIGDFKKLMVEDKVHILLIILAIWNGHFSLYHIIGAVGLTAPILIYAIIRNHIGGGDIKFIFANTIYWGLSKSYVAIVIGLVSIIIVFLPIKVICKRKKANKLPLVPFLSVGYFLVVLHYFIKLASK